MKRLILFISLFLFSLGGFAQSLKIKVWSSAVCDYTITMWGKCGCCGTTSCDQIASYQFIVPVGTTATWSDPCDFECGTSGVGFTSSVCSGCGGSCSAINFTWTFATLDFSPGSCSNCGTVGDLSGYVGCGSIPLTSTCGHSATWTFVTGIDIEINIY